MNPFLAAAMAVASSVSINGTIIEIGPSDEPGAAAEIRMHNVEVNTGRHNGAYHLEFEGIAVSVEFSWNVNRRGDDAITVTVTDGPYVAIPDTLAVPENTTGTLHIYPMLF